jgi:uncharacterized membrane protein (DUF2068 family)
MSDRPTRRRPFGVSVIIGIQVLSLLAAISTLLIEFAALTGRIEIDPNTLSIGDIFWSLLVTVLNLASIYGLWRMRRWAWFITMVDLGVSMLIGLYGYFYGEPDYWTMLFNVLIVFYLNQRDVQNAFVRRRNEARTL